MSHDLSCRFEGLILSADSTNLILLNESKQEVVLRSKAPRLTVPGLVPVCATVAPETLCFCLGTADVLAVSISLSNPCRVIQAETMATAVSACESNTDMLSGSQVRVTQRSRRHVVRRLIVGLLEPQFFLQLHTLT